MEDGLASLLVNGTELKLIIRHFVVLDLEGDSDFQQLALNLLHDFLNLAWEFAIVMVRKLLVFCTNTTEQASSSHPQVLTL